jgi:hypothetical protein
MYEGNLSGMTQEKSERLKIYLFSRNSKKYLKIITDIDIE